MTRADAAARPPSSHHLAPMAPLHGPGGQAAETQSRGASAMSMRAEHTNILAAPAPLPRIPGFTPAQTPDSIASARTPM